MYLGKLRDTAAAELKASVCDVVISVPGFFTDIQRRALLDAASIAGLNTLRLINDTTAVALGYGITKSDLPDPENPRHVVFVDAGHASLSVAIVAYSKGQLAIKGTAFNRNLGGRDFDHALVRHFSKEFKGKYNIDVLSNPKATFRLSAGCEKLKKVLSANSEAPLNVESIMSDVDASSKLSRETFESLIIELLDAIPATIQEAVANSGLTLEQIHSIELVGGSTRVPAVRARIQSVFPGKQLSTTLNQDEAVARGATFACAMLSPTFRVRDFHMHDIAPYTIKAHWPPNLAEPNEDTEIIVFPHGNSIPSTKILTFHRSEAFEVEASYVDPSALPGGINPWISKLTVKSVTPDGRTKVSDTSVVKVKTRLNLHGVLTFESAYLEEYEEKEEQQPMEVDGEQAQPAKKKRTVIKRPLPTVCSSSSLDSTTLERLKEQEAELHLADKLVMDTEVRFHPDAFFRLPPLTQCPLHRTVKMHWRNTSTI
jgi:heat shock protein 4